MMKKYITYGKTKIGTTWRINLDAMSFSSEVLNLLVVEQLTVTGFTHLMFHQKEIKDRI